MSLFCYIGSVGFKFCARLCLDFIKVDTKFELAKFDPIQQNELIGANLNLIQNTRPYIREIRHGWVYNFGYMDPNSWAFRRTQSLRYPKGNASTSNTNGFLTRKCSRHGGARSRSSKYRSGSSSNANSDSALARLSVNQRAALLISWRALKTQVAPLMRKIFQELEIVAPKVKDIFYKAALVDCLVQREFSTNATMDEHVKYMIKFFDDLILKIDCESETMEMIKRVGQHHAILNQSCGFDANIWEQLGEICMEKICSTDVVQKTRDAGRAWRTLIAFITDKLRCGFDTESKIFSRRSSADHLNEESNSNCEPLIQKLQRLRIDYNDTIPNE